MNRKILQKVIDELATENPRLDYVRGVLETLLDSLPTGELTYTPLDVTSNIIASRKTGKIEIPPPPASLNGLFLGDVKTEN